MALAAVICLPAKRMEYGAEQDTEHRTQGRRSSSKVRSKCPWHCHMCVLLGLYMCVFSLLIWFASPAFGLAAIIQQKLLTIMAHQPYNIPSNNGGHREGIFKEVGILCITLYYSEGGLTSYCRGPPNNEAIENMNYAMTEKPTFLFLRNSIPFNNFPFHFQIDLMQRRLENILQILFIEVA